MEEELNEEVRFHLEREIEENIARGMTPEEARYAAIRSFGGVERVKEESRDVRGVRLLEEVWQDLRYSERMMRKNFGFVVTAALTLALGFGVNTAIFSLVYAVLLSPLPYPQSERIVAVAIGARGITGGRPLTGPEFVELGKQNQLFDHWATFGSEEYILTGREAPEQLKGQRISQELLSVFSVNPTLGRAFLADEFQPGHDDVVLISHRLWQSRFGSDMNLIGRSVTLSQKSYTVLGIIPPDFNFFPGADVLLPLTFDGEKLSDQYCNCFDTVARLRPGVTIERVQRELNPIVSRISKSGEIRIYPVRELIVQNFRPTLFMIWGMVGFVLLIACANFANLLLARATNRQKEIAIRMAIGALRGRVIRQLLTESVLLALLGGAVGLFFAYLVSDALTAAGPVSFSNLGSDASPKPFPRLGEVGINVWVIVFTFGVSLLTGMAFGLAPALRLSRHDLNSFLKEGVAVSAAGFRLWRQNRLQSLLVVAEIALALVLLIGAGLLIRSFWQLQQVKLGFQPEKLLTITLQFPWYRYRDHSQVISFVGNITEYIEKLPGVQSVSATSILPYTRGENIRYIFIQGEAEMNFPPELFKKPFGVTLPPKPPPGPGKPTPYLYARIIDLSPRYFQTMQIPVRQGREFNEFDIDSSMPVMLINETMARRYWMGKDPIGERVRVSGSRTWMTVVGIVGDSMQKALENEAVPTLYRPFSQTVRRAVDSKESEAILQEIDYMHLAVRTTIRPEDLINAVQKRVWNLDPDQPALRIAKMENVMTKAFELPRFNMFLVGVLAGVALLLAAVGIYGLVNYLTVQRMQEISIRIALGAQKRDVLQLVIGQGLRLTVMGVAIGLAAAYALTQMIRYWLVGVSPTDPATFAVVTLLLISVTLLACYIPARRATRVDVVKNIRCE
jgi:putative ABC transport system permease protein